MFLSSKRRGKARDTSAASNSKVQNAINSVVEPLETRMMLTATVTYVVQTTSDTTTDQVTPAGVNLYKANTLRAAIDSANAQVNPVIIDLSKLPKNSTITLTSTAVHPAPTFVLGKTTLPAAPGSHSWLFTGTNNVTISGAGKYQIFNDGYASNVEFDNLTLAHGYISGNGAAIYAESTVTLKGGLFASNVATGDGGAVDVPDNTFMATGTAFTANNAEYGGAVYTEDNIGSPTQTVTSCTFTGNTASYEGGAIYNYGYIAGGGLVVTSCTFTGNSSADYGGAIYTEQDTSLDVTNLTVTNTTFTGNVTTSDEGGAIYTDEGGTQTFTSDTFTGNKAEDDYGGAIYAYEVTSLVIVGSTFSGNSAYYDGGGVYFEGAGSAPLLSVTNTSFTNNQSLDDYGGAIYNEGASNTTVAISGGSFTGNQCYDGGGAIYSDTGSTGVFTVTGTTFSKNIAHYDDGGAINTFDATVSITNSTFSGDKASDDYGGGLYADGLTTLTLSGDSFTNEYALYDGGAVYAYDGNQTVTNTTFTGNTAGGDEYGGGIYSYGTTLTVTGSTFNNNVATDEGGAIYADETLLNVSNSSFTGNQGDYGGGAIYSDGSTDTITGSTFTSNVELNTDDGGAIYSDDTYLLLDGDTFTGNSGYYGGALYADNTDTDIVDSTFSNNTASEYGGAIYTYSTEFELFDSTLNNNSATLYDGGGLYFDGTTGVIANDTFYGNSAGPAYDGGAIYNDSTTTTVTDSTIDANTAAVDGGGGIYNDAGTLTLDGDIVALNTPTGTPDTTNDLAGTFDPASSGNIIGDIGDPGVVTGFTAGHFGGNLVGTNANPIDPLLGPLANNGGTTQTQALLPGSPAINFSSDYPVVDNIFGLPTYNTDITATDQVGTARPSSGGYDSGAFQYIPGLNDHFVFVTPATATAGVSFPVTVEVFTDLNIPDNTFSEPVTITSSDAAATGLPGAGTLTFTNGIATFNPTLNTVGSQTFTITDTQVGTQTAPATSNPIVVSAPVVPVTPTISINSPAAVNAPISSGTTTLTFTVTLSAPAATTVTVNYHTQQGTASSGHGDYVGIPGSTLTFLAGQTSKTITVTINKAKFPQSVYGPPYNSGHPGVYFYVLLYNAQNAILGTATGIGTIEY